MAAPTNLFDPNAIKRLLPTFLRGNVHVGWLTALMVRCRAIYQEFHDNQVLWDIKRNYNSQTASLEAYLRYYFSDVNIFVLNLSNSGSIVYTTFLAENQSKPIVYFLSESEPPTFVRFLFEYDNSNLVYDFIVRFPVSFAGQADLIRYLVDFMKLAGKRWKLEFV